MIRKLALAIGLIFSLVGMILTLLVLEAVANYLGGTWPPIGIATISQNISFNDFMGLVSLPTALFVVFGFLLLVFATLYPKQSMEFEVEDEAAPEGNEEEEENADDRQAGRRKQTYADTES